MDGRSLRDAVTVVIATRNRRETLVRTLARLHQLPQPPAIVVVDDGSTDGSAGEVSRRFPDVHVIALPHRHGAVARNIGVRAATTPYVALNDDDSWWAAGALERAVECFECHPRVGLIAARVLVGAEERVDETSAAMAASCLPREPGLPGPRVLGFLACGAVLRREALLAAGGFPDRYSMGGEEDAVALAMASCGWDLVYLDDVIAHHHPPAGGGDRRQRRRTVARNDLRTVWRQRRGRGLGSGTVRVLRRALTDGPSLLGTLDAIGDLPWILRTRRPVAPHVEHWRRLLG